MPVADSSHTKKVVVATHGHCFDGAASAAVFIRLISHIEGNGLSFSYRTCGYSPVAKPLNDATLCGDINAVLDYRYSTHSNLHWYFDHHATAFVDDAHRAHFDSHNDGRKYHDPTYGCCAKLVAVVARDRFGLHLPELAPLLEWAEIIDTARFESPEQAIARQLPVLQLMTVIEHQGSASTLARFVPGLAFQHVEEVARDAAVRRAWKRLAPHHREFVKSVRERARPMGAVVLVDLSDQLREVVGKFVTYALYPDSSYSVVLTRSRTKLKLSIGFNPWSKHPRRHDIGAICARYGGGGHAVVGAVALPPTEIEQARQAACDIARELDG
ncbi:MAG: hypothetical protein ACOC1F_01800 [Myxococcota bacterium]